MHFFLLFGLPTLPSHAKTSGRGEGKREKKEGKSDFSWGRLEGKVDLFGPT